MQISYKPPADRGVTQLMYVGDDDAVENAISAGTKQKIMFVAFAALVYFMFKPEKPRR